MEINYENDTTILKFDYRQTMESLQRRIRQYQVPEDINLLQFIQQTSDNDITINEHHSLVNRFSYLVFDLVSAGQGTASCKVCCRQYKATDLTVQYTSSLSRPIKRRKLKRFLKREFVMKGPVNIPGFSLKRLLCPENHVLLNVRSWMS
jgi:hypothetical protein